MQKKDTILNVRDLKLWFDGDYASTQILNGIDFDVHAGETLGIAGESGCGKSMTSLSIMRLLKTPPARLGGTVEFEGKDLLQLPMKEMRRIRGNRISMIFQEPMTSLNPVFTIGFQMTEAIRLHQKVDRKAARQKAIEMLTAVHLSLPEKRMKQFPHELSGGMRQRVMIAMALSCRPELLIADEPTTALDVTIQAQVLSLMRELQRDMGTAILFITHDLGVIREMCDRVIVMYCGEIMEEAPCRTLFTQPLHPYTNGLLSTLPKYGVEDDLPTIPGMVPPAGHFPAGCVFAPRCPYATEQCRTCKPELVTQAEGHKVRCFRYTDRQEEPHGTES